jgi:hypothetical protein
MTTGTAVIVMAVISAAASFFISDFLLRSPRPVVIRRRPFGGRGRRSGAPLIVVLIQRVGGVYSKLGTWIF